MFWKKRKLDHIAELEELYKNRVKGAEKHLSMLDAEIKERLGRLGKYNDAVEQLEQLEERERILTELLTNRNNLIDILTDRVVELEGKVSNEKVCEKTISG